MYSIHPYSHQFKLRNKHASYNIITLRSQRKSKISNLRANQINLQNSLNQSIFTKAQPTIKNHQDYQNWDVRNRQSNHFTNNSLTIKFKQFISLGTIIRFILWYTIYSSFIWITGPAMKFLGKYEQFNLWDPKFLTVDIVAAYAETEFGHGSDVQNSETAATFDSQTKDFVLNTPSISAVKCEDKFIFNQLGLRNLDFIKLCACPCQVVFNGKNKGVHTFMVQIRDNSTRKPLKSLEEELDKNYDIIQKIMDFGI